MSDQATTKKTRKPKATKSEASNSKDETGKVRLVVKALAEKFNLEESSVIPMIQQMAFAEADPAEVRTADILAFMLTVVKYDLDPFMREIYALKNDRGRYEPVVGVDGWAKIIRRQENFGAIQFKYSENKITEGSSQECPEWIECELHLKDFHLPTVVREYLKENYCNTEYWNNKTSRLLRHRALIQSGRLAFGLSGIKDADEVLGHLKRKVDTSSKATPPAKAATPAKGGASEPVAKNGPLTGGLQAAKSEVKVGAAEAKPVAEGGKQIAATPAAGVGEPLFAEET